MYLLFKYNIPIKQIEDKPTKSTTAYSEKTEEQKKLDRIKRFGIIESKVEESEKKPTYKNKLLQNYNQEKYVETETLEEIEQSKLNK